MRKLFVLGLTISLLLISVPFALAAPCAGACGDEATCGNDGQDDGTVEMEDQMEGGS